MSCLKDILSGAEASRQRFAESAFIAGLWPQPLREPSLQAFELRQIVDDDRAGVPPPRNLAALRRVLTGSRREVLPLLLRDVDPAHVPIAHEAQARGVRHAGVSFALGAEALSKRDYARAVELFEDAQQLDPQLPIGPYRGLARTLAATDTSAGSGPPAARRPR